MPTPIRWACPTDLTAEEARVAQALHRIGKFYVFLREVRAELFDDAFQAELAAVYRPRGTAPVPPALLAMVLLLQAYDQVGDAERSALAAGLGCLGARAPFSHSVLVVSAIAHDLDRKLLERTAWRALRLAEGRRRSNGSAETAAPVRRKRRCRGDRSSVFRYRLAHWNGSHRGRATGAVGRREPTVQAAPAM